jgi:putative transposase
MGKPSARSLVLPVPRRVHPQISKEGGKEIGGVFRELCEQFGLELVEGHALPDHVHMCLSIPPKFSVANAIGKLKGKSAILIHRRFLGKTKNLTGYHFWARGYCVSSIGLNEDQVREYIRNQEDHELRQMQLPLQGLDVKPTT